MLLLYGLTLHTPLNATLSSMSTAGQCSFKKGQGQVQGPFFLYFLPCSAAVKQIVELAPVSWTHNHLPCSFRILHWGCNVGWCPLRCRWSQHCPERSALGAECHCDPSQSEGFFGHPGWRNSGCLGWSYSRGRLQFLGLKNHWDKYSDDGSNGCLHCHHCLLCIFNSRLIMFSV